MVSTMDMTPKHTDHREAGVGEYDCEGERHRTTHHAVGLRLREDDLLALFHFFCWEDLDVRGEDGT